MYLYLIEDMNLVLVLLFLLIYFSGYTSQGIRNTIYAKINKRYTTDKLLKKIE